MGRRAIWRSRTDDPQTLLAWILQTRWPATYTPDIGFGLTIALLAGGLCLSPWALLALPAVLLNFGRTSWKPYDLTPLATVPSPGPSFPCRLAIERGSENAVIGMDEGIVTFVDGWLYFAGRRTEFSIRAKDVRGLGDPPAGPRILLRDVTLDFRPRHAVQSQELLRIALAWYKSKSMVTGEPTLPPLGVHDSGVAAAWVDVIRSIAGRLASVGFLILVMRISAASVGGYFLIFPIFGFHSDALRRLEALRRMRRQDLQELTNLSQSAISP